MNSPNRQQQDPAHDRLVPDVATAGNQRGEERLALAV